MAPFFLPKIRSTGFRNLSFLVLGLFVVPSAGKWPARRVQRASQSPILSPWPNSQEEAGIQSCGCVLHHGNFAMLHCAQDASGTSRGRG